MRANAHHQSVLQSRAAQLECRALRRSRRPCRTACMACVSAGGGRTPMSGRSGAAIERHASATLVNQMGARHPAADAGTPLGAPLCSCAGLRARAHGDHGRHTGDRPLCRHESRGAAGPTLSRQWCVNAYAAGGLPLPRATAGELPWQKKIEEPGVMDLIERPTGHREARRAARHRTCPAAVSDLSRIWRLTTTSWCPSLPGSCSTRSPSSRIKTARILDPAKLANMRLELDLLERGTGTTRGSPPLT